MKVICNNCSEEYVFRNYDVTLTCECGKLLLSYDKESQVLTVGTCCLDGDGEH